jgi:RHS repeat-associated protein
LDVERSEAVALKNPSDPLSVASWTKTVSINGDVVKSSYDAANRTLTTVSAAGRLLTQRFDSFDRLISTQTDTLAQRSFTYDSKGRLATIHWGSGATMRTWERTLDDRGFLQSIRDPLGREVSFTRDAIGRATRKTLADGRVVNFAYDNNDDLIQITPPGRTAYTLIYNSVGLRSEFLAPAVAGVSKPVIYQYNADRDITKVTAEDGRSTAIDYDAAGRITSISRSRGAEHVSYSSTTGNLSTIDSPDGVRLDLAYDGRLPLSESWSGAIRGRLTRLFNDEFRAASAQINDESPITNHYDADGLLTSTGGLALTRNARNGLIIGTSLGDVVDAFTYSTFGEQSDRRTMFGGSVLYETRFMRDQIGRISTQVESIGGVTNIWTYTYDIGGRLTQVKRNGQSTAMYAYDLAGNRISRTTPGGIALTIYDAQDRVVTSGAASYTYGSDGRLRSRIDNAGTMALDYDEQGNLIGVVLPDTRTIRYLIDGVGRRVGKEINGTLRQGFLYDGQSQLVAELDGSSNVLSRFVYGSRPQTPDYMVRGGTTYRIVSDHLGSPRLVVEVSTGAIVQRIDYDEWGNVVSDSNPGFQPFGYAGGLLDSDTKLVRFGARDYDAALGRWTARDPMLFDGGLANLYAYVGNDPVNRTDPNGEDFWDGLAYTYWVGTQIAENIGSNVASWFHDKAADTVKEHVVDTLSESKYVPAQTLGKGIKAVDLLSKIEDWALRVQDAYHDPNGFSLLKCLVTEPIDGSKDLAAIDPGFTKAVEAAEHLISVDQGLVDSFNAGQRNIDNPDRQTPQPDP